MFCAGRLPAYHLAADALKKIGEISITGRHVGNLAAGIGQELVQEHDSRVDAYFDQNLPRILTEPSTPIHLATVSVDGGRIQTRADGGPNGVQDPHWRETKNALFMRISGVSFQEDPHPELPNCFAHKGYMQKLLSGVTDKGEVGPKEDSKSNLQSGRPERLFRTCLSSLCNSTQFGRMMEAEADARGFYRATKQAFVSDGLKYNWTIQQQHFPTFTPILYFTHAIGHLYEVARVLRTDSGDAWTLYVRWITACWKGQSAVIESEMKQEQTLIGQHAPGL